MQRHTLRLTTFFVFPLYVNISTYEIPFFKSIIKTGAKTYIYKLRTGEKTYIVIKNAPVMWTHLLTREYAPTEAKKEKGTPIFYIALIRSPIKCNQSSHINDRFASHLSGHLINLVLNGFYTHLTWYNINTKPTINQLYKTI